MYVEAHLKAKTGTSMSPPRTQLVLDSVVNKKRGVFLSKYIGTCARDFEHFMVTIELQVGDIAQLMYFVWCVTKKFALVHKNRGVFPSKYTGACAGDFGHFMVTIGLQVGDIAQLMHFAWCVTKKFALVHKKRVVFPIKVYRSMRTRF